MIDVTLDLISFGGSCNVTVRCFEDFETVEIKGVAGAVRLFVSPGKGAAIVATLQDAICPKSDNAPQELLTRVEVVTISNPPDDDDYPF